VFSGHIKKPARGTFFLSNAPFFFNNLNAQLIVLPFKEASRNEKKKHGLPIYHGVA
jgi:hypothetical protein